MITIRRILSAIFWIGSSRIFALVGALLRQKLLALVVGEGGFGIWGLLRPLIYLFEEVLPSGFQQGVTRQVAQLRAAGRERELETFVGAALSAFALPAVIVPVLVWFNAGRLSLFIFKSEAQLDYVRLTGLALPWLCLNGFFYALLRGFKAVRRLALISFSASLLTLALALPLIWRFELTGLLLAAVLIESIQTLLLLAICRRSVRLWPAPPRLAQLRVFAGLGLLILCANGLVWLANYYLRLDYWENFSRALNDQFEVAYRLISFMIAAMTASMTAYVFPRMSEISSRGELSREINLTLRTYLLVLAPALLLAGQFREELIILLFSRDYLPATEFFTQLLLFALLQVIYFPFATSLIPQRRHGLYLLLHVVYALSLPALYLLLRDAAYPVCRVTALAGGQLLLTALLIADQILRQRFRWEARCRRGLLAAALVLPPAFLLQGAGGLWRGCALPALPLWALAAVPLEDWRRYCAVAHEELKKRFAAI